MGVRVKSNMFEPAPKRFSATLRRDRSTQRLVEAGRFEIGSFEDRTFRTVCAFGPGQRMYQLMGPDFYKLQSLSVSELTFDCDIDTDSDPANNIATYMRSPLFSDKCRLTLSTIAGIYYKINKSSLLSEGGGGCQPGSLYQNTITNIGGSYNQK
jgi:hypothetical protein